MQARLLPGGRPSAGRGARAPPEVKAPKPPQRVAVGGTRRDRCLGPQRAGGGGEQWTTCQSECESPKTPPWRAGKAKEALLTLFLYAFRALAAVESQISKLLSHVASGMPAKCWPSTERTMERTADVDVLQMNTRKQQAMLALHWGSACTAGGRSAKRCSLCKVQR